METRRKSRKSEQTRKAIMHSAKLLFEQNGLDGVTISQITDGASVSRSTFFFHFDSVEDLLTEIAHEEINDIFSQVKKTDGAASVSAVFKLLTEDTYKYPSLMTELFIRSILSPGKGAVAKVDELLRNELEGESGEFSSKDLSAFIMGAYFGLIFQKFMNDESFDDPSDTYDKVQKLIGHFKET